MAGGGEKPLGAVVRGATVAGSDPGRRAGADGRHTRSVRAAVDGSDLGHVAVYIAV